MLQPAPVALIEAIRKEDAFEVARLLAQGAPAHSAQITARPVYDDAYAHEHEADPPEVYPCLLMAATHPAITRLLLEHGADPNASSDKGSSPLWRAAHASELECVRLLLNAGANPWSFEGRKGEIPIVGLGLSMMPDDDEIKSLLKKRMAEMGHRCDSTGYTSLMAAADMGDAQWIQELLPLDFKLDTCHAHKRALESACSFHLDDECARLLLTAGSDPNWADPIHGTTPLMFAAGLRSFNPHQDPHHSSFAHYAFGNRVKPMLALMAAGARVDSQAIDGSTALHFSAALDDPSSAAALLQAGANPNAANRLGITPLMVCAQLGKAATAQALFLGGSRLDSTNGHGEDFFAIAQRCGFADRFALLHATRHALDEMACIQSALSVCPDVFDPPARKPARI